jgi:hypothetical protein
MYDDDFIIALTLVPPAYEIRAFCACAIGKSGRGCMRRPRTRRPRVRRRVNSAPRGGGDDDGDGPPRRPRPLQRGGRS